MRTAVAGRNAALDAWRTRLNTGYMRVYSGTRPTNADTALAGNTLLAELRFNVTAFGAASSGAITANAITPEDAALADGTASFVRLLASNGSTVEADLSVGVGSGEAQFPSLTITTGLPVSCSSCVITYPVGT